MKKKIQILFFLLSASLALSAQNVSINEDGSAPDISAMLDISDTARGLLIPRMTAAQRIAISLPSNGLMVFQTDLEVGLYTYFSSQTAWSRVNYDSMLSLKRVLELGNDGNNDTIYNLNALSIGRNTLPKSALEIDSFLVAQGEAFSGVRWFGYNTFVEGGNVKYRYDGQIGLLAFGNGKTQLAHFQEKSAGAIISAEADSYIALDNNKVEVGGESDSVEIQLRGTVFVDSLRINNAYSFPDTIGTSGQILQSDGSGLSWLSPAASVSPWTNSASITYLSTGTQLGVGTSVIGTNVKQQIATSGAHTTGLLINHLATAAGTKKIGLQIDLNASGANQKYASISKVIGRNLGTDSLFGHYVEITPDNSASIPAAFAFKSKFLGTDGTTYGVYSENEDYNYFSGNIGAGTRTPFLQLSVGPVDDDTGFETNTDGNLEIYTNGVERVRIDETGKVGIGISNPSALLEFDNAIINKKLSLFTNVDNDHQFLGFGTGFGELRYQVDVSTTDHVFYSAIDGTSSRELMRIEGGGRVGIGQTNPADQLEVFSASFSRVRTETSSTNFSGFVAENTNGEYFMGVQGTADGNSGEFHIFQNSGSGNFGQRLVIDHQGRMGMGTTEPEGIVSLNSNAFSGVPGIFLDGFSTTVGSIAVDAGEIFTLGEWNGSTFTENIRVTATGQLSVASTNPNSMLTIGSSVGDLTSGIQLQNVNDDWYIYQNASLSFVIRDDGVDRLEINSSGDMLLSGSSIHTSDQRFKTDIVPMAGVLENILKLKGVYYYWDTLNYTNRGFSEERQVGLIAQDLQKVYPELVHTDKKGYLAVDYSKFTAVLLQAIKEQQKLLNEQQKSNQQQQNQIDALKNEMNELKKIMFENE